MKIRSCIDHSQSDMSLNSTSERQYSQQDINGKSFSFSMIHIAIQVILFFIGTFIQIKTISICKQEKGATWKIHVIHSVILIINFTFNISFDSVIYFMPSLSNITGPWICYLSSFLAYYCFYSIVANSLIISIMKYLFIVHQILPSSEKGSRIKSVFIFIYLLHPLFLTICNIITSDWGTFSSVEKCFSYTSNNSNDHKITPDDNQDEKSFLCILEMHNTKMHDIDIHFFARQIVCILRTIVNLAANTNILEVFFYYKIFRKMRR